MLTFAFTITHPPKASVVDGTTVTRHFALTSSVLDASCMLVLAGTRCLCSRGTGHSALHVEQRPIKLEIVKPSSTQPTPSQKVPCFLAAVLSSSCSSIQLFAKAGMKRTSRPSPCKAHAHKKHAASAWQTMCEEKTRRTGLSWSWGNSAVFVKVVGLSREVWFQIRCSLLSIFCEAALVLLGATSHRRHLLGPPLKLRMRMAGRS